MSRLKQIVGQVKGLNQDELKEFREWFAAYDAEIWDRQLEADAANGRLSALSDRAVRDHEDGQSTEL